MKDQDLADLLERGADRTPVGPPPFDEMLARIRNVRRRRNALAITASVATVVAVVFGTTVLSGLGGSPEHRSPPGATASSPPASSASTALNGTWTVRALLDPDGHSAIGSLYVHKVRMTFDDGEMTGDTGCNSISGTYRQSGDRGQGLLFSRGLGSTLVGCRDEPPLVRRLLDVRSVSGSGDIRVLHDEGGKVVAELQRP